MLTIGLTGGIGSGKTTVAKAFECLGVKVYYSDVEAKRIMRENPMVKDGIIKLMGEQAYTEDNNVNSGYIAGKIFENKHLLEKMNAIVHPAVYNDFFAYANFHSDYPYMMFESAIIIETGRQTSFDKLIVVTAPLEERVRRVMARNNATRKEVLSRIKRQASQEQLTGYAHYTVFNDGKIEIIPQILMIDEYLRKLC